MPQILNFKALSIDQIEYNKPTEGSNYNSYALYNSSENGKINPINLQTSYFTIGGFKGNEKKCILDVKFIDDVNSNKFFEFITDLDNYNVKTAVMNSLEWFGEKLDETETDDYYKTALHFNRNKLPYLRLNVDLKDDKPNIGIFNKHGYPKELSDIKKDQKVKCIIEYHGLKFGKNKFSPILKLKQIQLCEDNISYNEDMYMFVDSDEEDDETTVYNIKEYDDNNEDNDNDNDNDNDTNDDTNDDNDNNDNDNDNNENDRENIKKQDDLNKHIGNNTIDDDTKTQFNSENNDDE